MKNRLFIIPFLLFFIFLGSVKSGFSVGCAPFQVNWQTNWDVHSKQFSSESDAESYCRSSDIYGGNCSYCFPPPNTDYAYICWKNDWTNNDQYFGLYCAACESAYSQAASQCGGDDEYNMDVETCEFTCKCTDERAQASQQCGGDDKYTIDEQTCEFECTDTPGTCPAGCESVCQQKETECGIWGYSVVKDATDQCSGSCNVNPSCAQAYEAKCIECGSCDKIRSWNNDSCMGVCQFDNCVDQMNQADQACPFGYAMDKDTCEWHCKTCQELVPECQASCSAGSNPVGLCNESNGAVTDFACDCDKPNDCSSFYDACAKACSAPGCDGVKTKQCQQDSGQVVYSECKCNSCSNDPAPRDPHDPAPDPQDDSDLTGWVKAIKENTDTMVSQGDDQSGWLEGIESNTDDVENLLGIIAKKDFSPEVKVSVSGGGTSVDTSGVVAAENATTAAVGELKTGLSGSKMTASVEGVEDLGTTGDITGAGYVVNATPANAALPAAADIDAAFGEAPVEAEGQTNYRTAVTDALDSLSPPFSSPVCSVTFTVPSSMPFIGGETYPMDFCPYGDGLALVGNILIFLAALRELYLFS